MQEIDRSPGSENDWLPNQSEVCHYHSQAQSDLQGVPFDDMRVEIA